MSKPTTTACPQLEACRAYAQQHDFQVLEEITDDCSGSIPVMARPGGGKVYDYLNNLSIAAVIMYTIDRSTRDKREYPIEFMIFLRDVQDAGAELHFVDTGRSDGGIIDMFRAWQAAQAQLRANREQARRNRLHEYLLGGRVTCWQQRLQKSQQTPAFGAFFVQQDAWSRQSHVRLL